MTKPTHLLLAAACAGLIPCAAALAVGSSAAGAPNVNSFLGAEAFYNSGITGTSAVVANVEGYWMATSNASLGKVSVFLGYPGVSVATDAHPTWCGGIIAGTPFGTGADQVDSRGIAYGATLWSASIASGVPLGGGGYTTTPASLGYGYGTVMSAGVDGVKADVVSSSWGLGATIGTGGNDPSTTLIDGLADANGTTMVFAAGNSGPGANSIGAPGSGFNMIVVGALTGPNFDTIASFSSRSPSNFTFPVAGVTSTGVAVPAGASLSKVRAVVDLCAPGTGLSGPSDSGNGFDGGLDGTSVAAPIVSGGAALIVDAGKTLFPNDALAHDGRVVKAVLLNSADKPVGWNNGQTALPNGVIQTKQALDYTYGAGDMNLGKAFTQFTSGTADVPGLTGGTVRSVGWDYGNVVQASPNDYYISSRLAGGSTFAVTLDWFVDATTNLSTSASEDDSFDNLDLQVWSSTDGLSPLALIAESSSYYNDVEHLYFALPSDGYYMVRVIWAGEVYDRYADANNDDYALAWSGNPVAAPEPVALSPLPLAAPLLSRRRRLPNHPLQSGGALR